MKIKTEKDGSAFWEPEDEADHKALKYHTKHLPIFAAANDAQILAYAAGYRDGMKAAADKEALNRGPG